MSAPKSIEELLPAEAVGLCLYRITKQEELIACEPVRFVEGRGAVGTTLRRAKLSGRVDVGGDIAHHFADVLDNNSDIIETVALDAKSYSALKNHWMRCKVDPVSLADVQSARPRNVLDSKGAGTK